MTANRAGASRSEAEQEVTMEYSAYWVPYKTDDVEHACVVIGPFQSRHHASMACDAMRRASSPSEYVGDVLSAASEVEALLQAEAIWMDHRAGAFLHE